MTTLLFVCTGNICRSPMAVALTGKALSGRPESVDVSSAGLLAGGQSPTPEGITVMKERGLDVSGHRSKVLAGALSGPPGLILGMAREHCRAVLEQDPSLFERTFTLKEFVRRGRTAGPRGQGEGIGEYLERVGEGRKISELASIVSRDDVDDPIGKGLAAYERCAEELEGLVNELVELLFPSA